MTADPNITRLMAEAEADYRAAMLKAKAECGSSGDIFRRIDEQPECGRPGWLDEEAAPENLRARFWECVLWLVVGFCAAWAVS